MKNKKKFQCVFERTKNEISPHLSNFITNSIKCQFDHLGFILHVM